MSIISVLKRDTVLRRKYTTIVTRTEETLKNRMTICNSQYLLIFNINAFCVNVVLFDYNDVWGLETVRR